MATSYLLPAICKYDYVFGDLWHDVSDGYLLYVKMKGLECLKPGITFLYWIETSLLSYLHRQVFQQIDEAMESSKNESTTEFAHAHLTCFYNEFLEYFKV